MIFANYKELAVSPLRKKVLRWASSGIESVLPKVFMPRSVKVVREMLYVNTQKFNISGKRIFVIGAGKASSAMAASLEKILGHERITDGVVISNDTTSQPQKIRVHFATHPVPSQQGVLGSKKILRLKTTHAINERDVIIALLSGGGSSLMPHPIPGITLYDKKKLVKALIQSGANVHEMTLVKKKLSRVKGGKLALHFAPTPLISLVLSDVIGNNLEVIASGPFTVDKATTKDAMDVIRRHKSHAKIPSSVMKVLSRKKEPLRYGEESFRHVHQAILADNDTALRKIASLARGEGIRVYVKKSIQGETKNVAYAICERIRKHTIDRPTLFLYGGETTVTLPERHGIGGRNQEFVLACLEYFERMPLKYKWCAASVGTDGVDFIDESTGGIIDESSLRAIKEKEFNARAYLKRHDAQSLLKKINANIYVEGTTGTNVCDIMMFFLTP